MINRKELKDLSKEQLRGQWTLVVLITLLFGVIQFLITRLTGEFQSTILAFIISTVVTTTISIFTYTLYLKLTRGTKVKFKDMFLNSEAYLKSFGVSILGGLIMIPAIIVTIFLGTIVMFGVFSGIGITDDFILPNNLENLVTTSFNFDYLFKFFLIFLLILLVVSIPIYFLSIYLYPSVILMCEDDSRGVGECIGMSFRLMKGNMWSFFLLQLSYLGWIILSCLSLGIGFLWLTPYMNTVNMNFFNKIVGYDSNQMNPNILTY